MHNETDQLRNTVHTKCPEAYSCVGIHPDDTAIYLWHAYHIISSKQWSLQGCLDLILCLFYLLGVALLDLL